MRVLRLVAPSFQKYMTAYGLRATMTSQLIEGGHGNARIVHHKGISDTYTLSLCHNFHGTDGWKQQVIIFNDSPNFDLPHSGQASIVKMPKLAE